MITFTTIEQNHSTPYALSDRAFDDLVLADDTFVDWSVQVIRYRAPDNGWSHEQLIEHASEVVRGDAYLVPAGEAFKRTTAYWIGGTDA